MIIQWYGENCFRLKIGDTSILTDPTNKKLKGDLTIYTSYPFKDLEKFQSAGIINYPGEYELKNIFVTGFLNPGSNQQTIKTIYQISWNNFLIGILGYLKPKELNEWQKELGNIDILFIPVGGKPFISIEQAVELVKYFKPKLVIPTLFKQIKQVSLFAKQLGKFKLKPQLKIAITSSGLERQELEIGCLTKS